MWCFVRLWILWSTAFKIQRKTSMDKKGYWHWCTWICAKTHGLAFYNNDNVIMIIEIVRRLLLLFLTMTSLSNWQRMKGLFEPELAITFANKESVLELNGCSIKGLPCQSLRRVHSLIQEIRTKWCQTCIWTLHCKIRSIYCNVTNSIHSWWFVWIIEKEPEALLLSWNISLILRQAIRKVLKWWHQYNEW